MKKILIFLTIGIITFFSFNKTINAKTDTFYEAEYLDNIYMVRYNKQTKTKYYQKARLYRRTSDGKIAYCLQPFVTFNTTNNTYETVDQLPDIDEATLTRLNDIIGFGYNYSSHTDLKWYAITQLMIWQTVDPNNEFYFTDTLNGNKINIYDEEINIINNLINSSYKLPSFNNMTFYGITGKPITITDTNNIISFYSLTSNKSVISNNTVTVNSNTDGCFEEIYLRHYNYDNNPILFYYNPNSQSLATTGSIAARESKVKFCFNTLKLQLIKVDKDTNEKTSQGEASLKESEFTIYNASMEPITTLILDENLEATITSNDYDLTYGTYYLKETKTGTGYLTNNKLYEINFQENNTTITLTIPNEVIKNELVIKKYYGDGKLMHEEKGIIFEIYDLNNNLIDTITTNEKGETKITLPYGHYKIVQANTTEGYTKIEPFEIFIDDINKNYHYTINDYKIEEEEEEKEDEEKEEEKIEIKVPNTATNTQPQFLLNTIIIGLYYAKKKCN